VSDESDAMFMTPDEYGHPVTTDRSEVAEFLAAPGGGAKVVFCTYSSAQVLADAMPETSTFDLAIFDEAHKTAGADDKAYGFALSDANIRARKRVFFTATPRFVRHARRDNPEVDAICSMDNEAVYGKVAHFLGCREAIRRGLIVPYKIVISAITSDQVTRAQISAGSVEGGVATRHDIASHLALRQAIDQYRVKKIFTFHSRIEDAARFIDARSEVEYGHDELFAAHICGQMDAAHRAEVLDAFGAASVGVVSNARCLTEGVDVPAVDLVAFLSRKRSRIDIIQATGRALRNSPGKKVGYIFLPLLIELGNGESLDQALTESVYDEVWAVIEALVENDDAFADLVCLASEETGQHRRLLTDLSEFIQVVGSVSLPDLQRAVTTRLIQDIGDVWSLRLGQLREFIAKHGHCAVSTLDNENPSLGGWVSTQRDARKVGLLTEKRIKQLDALGFVWDYRQWKWQWFIQQLVAFRRKFGHCDVEYGSKEWEDLYNWAGELRGPKGRVRLTPEKIAQLDSVGFIWDVPEFRDLQRIGQLKQFKAKHGNTSVPIYDDEYPGLGIWVRGIRNRRNRKCSNISTRVLNELEAIQFDWVSIRQQKGKDAVWNKWFGELNAYKEQHGHCNVVRTDKNSMSLLSWVTHQRRDRRNGVLDADKNARLTKLGFEWERPRGGAAVIVKRAAGDAKMAKRVDEFAEFVKTQGHPHVPTGKAGLGFWVRRMRALYANGKLSVNLIEKLNALGFCWKLRWDHWLERVNQLELFVREQGNVNVPRRGQYAELYAWLVKMRQAARSGSLPRERIEKLQTLGVDF